jgi:hypothetical protein
MEKLEQKGFNFIMMIFVILSSVFLRCDISIGERMPIKFAKYHFFNFHSDADYKSTNGYDFFENEDNIYNIIWQSVGKRINYGYDSKLVANNKNNSDWTVVHIPGKAYYLGPYFNHEICSIRQNNSENKWQIAFYDLKGTKLREIEHNYQKFDKEYYHYTPVPLVYPDGSLIFYSMYEYEGRNIFLKSLLGLVSGGHGSKRLIGEYIEIIPSLIRKEGKKKSFSYIVGYDSSNLRTVFPADGELLKEIGLLKKRTFNTSGYEIDAYELLDKEIILLLKEGNLIKLSKNIDIIDTITKKRNLVPLPTLDVAILKDGKPQYAGYSAHDLDVWSDSNSITLVTMKGKKVYVDFYDTSSSEWTRNIINKNNIDFYGYRNLRIYKTQKYLYMGFWADWKKFEIIKCNLIDLKSEGVIDLIKEE